MRERKRSGTHLISLLKAIFRQAKLVILGIFRLTCWVSNTKANNKRTVKASVANGTPLSFHHQWLLYHPSDQVTMAGMQHLPHGNYQFASMHYVHKWLVCHHSACMMAVVNQHHVTISRQCMRHVRATRHNAPAGHSKVCTPLCIMRQGH